MDVCVYVCTHMCVYMSPNIYMRIQLRVCVKEKERAPLKYIQLSAIKSDMYI